MLKKIQSQFSTKSLSFAIWHRLFFASIALFTISCNFLSRETENLFDQTTLAIVGNSNISLKKFHAEKDFYSSYIFMQNGISQKQTNKFQHDRSLLEAIINEEILLQHAKSKDIKVTDAEFAGFVEKISGPYLGGNFQKLLDDVYLDNKAWNEKLHNLLIIQKLINTQVRNKIVIKEQDIQDYYTNHPEEFSAPELRNVYHLQIDSSDLVIEILAALKRGRSFHAMIESYSLAIDRNMHGNLGFLDRNFLPEIFSDPIFKIKRLGGITGAIRTSYGIHIFMVQEIVPAKTINLEDIRTSIKEKLIDQQTNQFFDNWFNNLKAKSKVLINFELLKTRI